LPESNYRSKPRILADILSAIADEGEAKPTHVMNKSNLSYDRLLKFLGNLEKGGFVERKTEGDKSVYTITDKGRYFLREFRKVEEFTIAFGLKL
jgi:predicted transcriptional regulator